MGTAKGRGGRVALGALLCAGLSAGSARDAHAQERFNTRVGRVTNGRYYRATVAVRMNPIGVFAEARAGYRHRLFDPGRGPILLRNTYFAIAPSVALSPAFVRPGVALELSPLAILNLSAVFEYVQYFGSFNLAQTFQNASAQYSSASVFGSAFGRDGGAETARGLQVHLSALLQARAGDLVVRSNFRGIYFDLTFSKDANNAPAGSGPGPVFYDQFFDALAPTRGWLFVNDTDLLYSSPDLGLTLGLRFSATMPIYTAREYGSGPADADQTTLRLGPLFAYTFREGRHGAFNAPSMFVAAQWWIRHPYRTEGVGAALPMIAIGFSFRGDR